MLISQTRRVTTLGQTKPAISPHIGPGSYLKIQKARKDPVYTPFGTSAARSLGGDGHADEPGPGSYRPKAPTSLAVSNAFRTKVSKFGPQGVGATVYLESSIASNPGPGQYNFKGMGSVVSPEKRHWKRPSDFPKTAPKMNPPSIPRVGQSYGYVEKHGGVLELHEAPEDVYSGLGPDTIGPAYYNPQPARSKTAPNQFRLDKSERKVFQRTPFKDNTRPDNDNPGPAKYNPREPRRTSRVRVKPSSSFASTVPFAYDPVQEELALRRPGPGAYNNSRRHADVPYAGPESFHSTTARNTSANLQNLDTPLVAPTNQHNPGPGDYETNVSSFRLQKQETLTDVDIGFGSTDARYCLSAVKSAHDAAPGDAHDDVDSMFGSIGHTLAVRSKLGKRGVFGTTTARIKPNTFVNGEKVPNHPGPSDYNPSRGKFQRTRPSSVFKSSASRLARVSTALPPGVVQVGVHKQPGVGTYNVSQDLAPTRKAPTKSFGATVHRFTSKQIFFGVNLSDAPGPGLYRSDHNDIRRNTRARRRSLKPKPSFGSSSTKTGFGSYYKKSQGGDHVGPGAYHSRNSMLKKSFNTRAGHTSARSRTATAKNAEDPQPSRRNLGLPSRVN